MEDFIFIFPVYIREPENKELWKESVRCIRKFYNNQIIIIIDNCDYNSLGIDDNDYPNNNLKFIELNEFKGAGEFLPYYYLLKYKPAKKAIIIQDSIFIQKELSANIINEIKDIKFLWHFNLYKHENYPLLFQLLENINNKDELINLYINENLWCGCFGIANIISLDFLEHLNNKYNFLKLLGYFNNNSNENKTYYKQIRCCFERLFALLCFNELKWNINDSDKFSLNGLITNHYTWGHYSLSDYKNKINFENNPSFIKCWNNR